MIYIDRKEEVTRIFGSDIDIGYFENKAFIYKKNARTFEESRIDHSDIKISWFRDIWRLIPGNELGFRCTLFIFNGLPQFDTNGHLYRLSELIGLIDVHGNIQIDSIEQIPYNYYSFGTYDFYRHNIKTKKPELMLTLGRYGHISINELHNKCNEPDLNRLDIIYESLEIGDEKIKTLDLSGFNIDNYIDDFISVGYLLINVGNTQSSLIRSVPNFKGNLLSARESELFLK